MINKDKLSIKQRQKDEPTKRLRNKYAKQTHRQTVEQKSQNTENQTFRQRSSPNVTNAFLRLRLRRIIFFNAAKIRQTMFFLIYKIPFLIPCIEPKRNL